GAATVREGAERRGIPALKIEVTARGAGWFRAPGILAMFPLGSAISSALPLSLGGQVLPCPAGVRARLCLAYVHRPVQRKRHFFEHAKEVPCVGMPSPKTGMADVVLTSPGPIFLCPEFRSCVTTRCKKFEILLIRHLVLIDRKCGHIHRLRFEFVIPTKCVRIVATRSQGDRASRDSNHGGERKARGPPLRRFLWEIFFSRKLF